MTDSASNVVGIVGVRAARQPPDEDHPYGHRKYETVAAAAVAIFLLLVVVEVLRNAFNRLSGRALPVEISTASFVVMFVTVAINLVVILYEGRETDRLVSEVLLADTLQTRGLVEDCVDGRPVVDAPRREAFHLAPRGGIVVVFHHRNVSERWTSR